MTGSIKVLIIEDSAFIRTVLTEVINRIPGVQVVGTARDPIVALDKIRQTNPDVLTLDVEMPRMDGLTFLQKIMAEDPRPVLMISAWTAQNSDMAIKAMALGAFDYITKPTIGLREGMAALEAEIRKKVIQAAFSKEKIKLIAKPKPDIGSLRSLSVPINPVQKSSEKVIAIGASTGGTVAITQILRELPANMPGIVIIQHMPENFTASFATSLNSQCKLTVKEAADGDRIMAGQVLVAKGNYQLKVLNQGSHYYVRVISDPPLNLHRPSVDYTFYSIASYVGNNAMGILLTGMGEDGARGLKAMRDVGCLTIAQDEKSSVVYGMPRKAAEIGGATKICPLHKIGQEIQRWAVDRETGTGEVFTIKDVKISLP